jgi:hypothetical protein
MLQRFVRPAIAATLLLVAGAVLAAGLVLRPAIAAGGSVTIGPFAIVHCMSTSACEEYKNTGRGPGVEGVITTTQSSETGAVLGSATGVGIGVLGQANSGSGVSGTSTSGAGVMATSGSSYGLYASSTSGPGVEAYSGSGAGLSAGSSSADAIDATAGSGGVALSATGYSGAAIKAAANMGGGVAAIEAVNTGGSGGNGGDFDGYFGLVGRSAGGSGGPMVGTDSSGSTVFWIDYAGDVNYLGSLNQFLRTRGGEVATAYQTTAASPTIEDDGTGHLVAGYCTVTLDPTFAQSIDLARPYHVVLTPDGDTRGLYVASKSPTMFVVREVQGGRNSLDFDYHIYAPALGHAGQQMHAMSPAQAAAIIPHVPMIRAPRRPDHH